MRGYSRILIFAIVATVLCLHSALAKTAKSPAIESGKLYLRVFQASASEPELFQLSYDSSVKSELKLTQNSKI